MSFSVVEAEAIATTSRQEAGWDEAGGRGGEGGETRWRIQDSEVYHGRLMPDVHRYCA